MSKTHESFVKLDEMTFSSLLAPAMQYQVEVKEVKALLALAKKHGLDPAKLYNQAVKVRSDRWMAAPPYEEVDPASNP